MESRGARVGGNWWLSERLTMADAKNDAPPAEAPAPEPTPAATAPASSAAAPASSAAPPASSVAPPAVSSSSWVTATGEAPPVVRRSEPVVLGGKEFASGSELWNYMKALRESLDRDAELEGKVLAIVKDLLDKHPRAAEKKGDGVQSISYGEHPTYKGTQCFIINRVDGTTSDFSFRKCIDILFPGGGKRKRNSNGRRGDPGSKRSPEKRQKSTRAPSTDGSAVRIEYLPKRTPFGVLKDKLKEAFGETAVRFVNMGVDGSSAVVTLASVDIASRVAKEFKTFEAKELEVSVITG